MLHHAATGRVRHNMLDPVPAALLGRLAIDRGWQGRGLGAALLQDAVLRVLGAAESIGVRAILVHAISEAAKALYEHWGLRPSPEPFAERRAGVIRAGSVVALRDCRAQPA